MNYQSDTLNVEFIWGNSLIKEGYTKIDSFQCNDLDFNTISITVPENRVTSISEIMINLLSQKLKNEFLMIFNTGDIIENERLEISHTFSVVVILGFYDTTGKLNIVKFLNQNEFEKFNKAQSVISEFYRDVIWYQPIIENHKHYEKIIGEIWKKYNQTGHPDVTGYETIKVNSAFSNWLTSITGFINHMEKRSKRVGPLLGNFHELINQQRDNNFSYRLIYFLRNYIQHQAPPIYPIYKFFEENNDHIRTVNFCIKLDLMEDDKFIGKFKKDNPNISDVIEINPHISSMMESLNRVLSDYIINEFGYLHDNALFVRSLVDKIPQGNNRGIYGICYFDNVPYAIEPHVIYKEIVDAILSMNVKKIIDIIQNPSSIFENDPLIMP